MSNRVSLKIVESESVKSIVKSGKSKSEIIKEIKQLCDSINEQSSGLSYLLHRGIQEDLSSILIRLEALSKLK